MCWSPRVLACRRPASFSADSFHRRPLAVGESGHGIHAANRLSRYQFHARECHRVVAFRRGHAAAKPSPYFQTLALSVSPGNTTPANRAPKLADARGVAVEQASTIALHVCRRCTARAGSARESLRPRRTRDPSAAGCGRRTAGRAAPAAATPRWTARSRAPARGGSDDVDGPRSPPKPPSPRAKIDRFCVHSGVPSGRGDRRLRPDHRGLALVPDVGEPGDRVPVPDGGIGAGARHRLAGVQHPATARCRCRGTSPTAARSCGSSARRCRTSAAPAGCRRRDSAARACPSGRGPRRARGGRAGCRYWSTRIRPGRQFGAERFVEVDRHQALAPPDVQRRQVAERHRRTDRAARARGRCGPSPAR